MKITKQTKQIERFVDKHFPDCPKDLPRAYRYSPASIRVRIVDKRFDGRNRSERNKMVMPLIRTLPEEIREELTMLLLLAPNELEDSRINREYAEPSPSLL